MELCWRDARGGNVSDFFVAMCDTCTAPAAAGRHLALASGSLGTLSAVLGCVMWCEAGGGVLMVLFDWTNIYMDCQLTV